MKKAVDISFEEEEYSPELIAYHPGSIVRMDISEHERYRVVNSSGGKINLGDILYVNNNGDVSSAKECLTPIGVAVGIHDDTVDVELSTHWMDRSTLHFNG